MCALFRRLSTTDEQGRQDARRWSRSQVVELCMLRRHLSGHSRLAILGQSDIVAKFSVWTSWNIRPPSDYHSHCRRVSSTMLLSLPLSLCTQDLPRSFLPGTRLLVELLLKRDRLTCRSWYSDDIEFLNLIWYCILQLSHSNPCQYVYPAFLNSPPFYTVRLCMTW